MPSLRVTVLLVTTLLLGPAFQTQNPPGSRYSDSPDGFRQQLEDLVSTYKSGDQAAFRADLGALAIPNANEWIANHFPPTDVPKLQHDYPLSLDGFQRYLTSLVDDAAHPLGWVLTAKPSDLPPPPGADAEEQSLPSSSQAIAVENFRYGWLTPEGQTPRSAVNSFVYLDGRFRYVGGTFPFWWEELQRIRRPKMLSGNIHAARLIHKVAPEYPKKARKQHIEGVVRLHAIIGKDGAPRSLTVISGDELLTPAALKAVQQWRYEPVLLNGSPVEVDTTISVVFQLNRQD